MVARVAATCTTGVPVKADCGGIRRSRTYCLLRLFGVDDGDRTRDDRSHSPVAGAGLHGLFATFRFLLYRFCTRVLIGEQ